MNQQKNPTPKGPQQVMSVEEALQAFDIICEPSEKLWSFSIQKFQDSALAASIAPSNSGRLSLANDAEIFIAPVEVDNQNHNWASLYHKSVKIDKMAVVRETFLEENKNDPAALHLVTHQQVFTYTFATPGDFTLIAQEAEDDSHLIPLQKQHLVSYEVQKYNIMQKTALQKVGNTQFRAYLLVSEVENLASCLFLQINRVNTDWWYLISPRCVVELRFPKDNANKMKNYCHIPNFMGVLGKIQTTQCLVVPTDIEIYVDKTAPIRAGEPVLSVASVSDRTFSSKLVTVSGTIVARTDEPGTYGREKKTHFTQGHFGLPGKNSVILLDLVDGEMDPVRLYLGWQSMNLYPLGIIPGATIAVSFVYKAVTKANKPYLRATHLSGVSILKPPLSASFDADAAAVVPIAPTPKQEPIKLVMLDSLEMGASGWVVLDNPLLLKVTVEVRCKVCQQTYENGVCSNYCGSGSEGDVVAKANVVTEDATSKETIFVNGEAVQILLNASPSDWESILVMAREERLTYYKGSSENEDLNTYYNECFSLYCEATIMTGTFFFCKCRRFKKSGAANSVDLFCIELVPASSKRASDFLFLSADP